MAKAEVRENHGDDRVDRPGVQTPVKEGQGHRFTRRGDGSSGAVGRAEKVHDRLGDTEKHQADAHAGGKQHGEPGNQRVFRFGVIGAQLDVAEARQRDRQGGHQNGCNDQHVVPRAIGDDRRLQIAEQRPCGLRQDGREADDRHQQACGPEKNGLVERRDAGGRRRCRRRIHQAR